MMGTPKKIPLILGTPPILLVELKPEEESLGVCLDGRNLAALRAHTLLLNHKTPEGPCTQ